MANLTLVLIYFAMFALFAIIAFLVYRKGTSLENITFCAGMVFFALFALLFGTYNTEIGDPIFRLIIRYLSLESLILAPIGLMYCGYIVNQGKTMIKNERLLMLLIIYLIIENIIIYYVSVGSPAEGFQGTLLNWLIIIPLFLSAYQFKVVIKDFNQGPIKRNTTLLITGESLSMIGLFVYGIFLNIFIEFLPISLLLIVGGLLLSVFAFISREENVNPN